MLYSINIQVFIQENDIKRKRPGQCLNYIWSCWGLHVLPPIFYLISKHDILVSILSYNSNNIVLCILPLSQVINPNQFSFYIHHVHKLFLPFHIHHVHKLLIPYKNWDIPLFIIIKP